MISTNTNNASLGELEQCIRHWCNEFKFDLIRGALVVNTSLKSFSDTALTKSFVVYSDDFRDASQSINFQKVFCTNLANGYSLLVEINKHSPFNSEQKKQADMINNQILSWGNFWLDFHSTNRLDFTDEYSNSSNDKFQLSEAERNVLLLLAEGNDGTDISQARGVSKETVRSQIKALLHKTGCRNQNHLICCYYKGLIR